jgi:hypothetical protein
LIVEEAWYLMQNEDSARFIYGIAKRARKYYLGLTTISQDVDDFLTSEYGKAIVTNSSIQILFKQHPAAIDRVAEIFYLSEGEKRLLLAADVGEGLFFAGANHVAIKVMASEAEHKLITTNPEEILRLREEGKIKPKKPTGNRPVYKPFNPEGPDDYTTFDKSGNAKPEFAPKSQSENTIVDTEPTIAAAPKTSPVAPVPVVSPAAPVADQPSERQPSAEEIISSVKQSTPTPQPATPAPQPQASQLQQKTDSIGLGGDRFNMSQIQSDQDLR